MRRDPGRCRATPWGGVWVCQEEGGERKERRGLPSPPTPISSGSCPWVGVGAGWRCCRNPSRYGHRWRRACTGEGRNESRRKRKGASGERRVPALLFLLIRYGSFTNSLCSFQGMGDGGWRCKRIFCNLTFLVYSSAFLPLWMSRSHFDCPCTGKSVQFSLEGTMFLKIVFCISCF